nr:213_t:CDS:2 [Entrophospora candida]CAG8594943.1 4209_t:CDS:2 [Entrophospora candida]
MLRRKPTKLEIRQDDIEQLEHIRQIYKQKSLQPPGISGKGKRCTQNELVTMIKQQQQQQTLSTEQNDDLIVEAEELQKFLQKV